MKGMLSYGLMLFLVLSLRDQTTISINTDSSIYYGKRNTHKIINRSFTNTSGIPIEIIGIKHLNSDSSVFGLFDLGMELKRQRAEVDSAKSIYCSYDLGVISRFKSYVIAKRKATIEAGILDDCIRIPGLYTVRFILRYKLESEKESKEVKSNWIKLVVE